MPKNPAITLRRANAHDCQKYYEWSQDPDVRANSYHSEPFPYEVHKKWFHVNLYNEHRCMYVLESDGEPAGQIRYEIENGDAEINFSVGRDYRGKGLGYRLLNLGGRSLLMEHPEVHTIHGYVMENNESSKRSFMRAGFYVEKYENIEGRKSVKYVLQLRKAAAGFHF